MNTISEKKFVGPYVFFRDGHIHIKPYEYQWKTSEYTKCDFSILSPGTESWQLEQSKLRKEDFPAGYMAIGTYNKSFVLAPAPHNSLFPNDLHGSLFADTELEKLVLARFQLIAAINFPEKILHMPTGITVVGSGPVAVGALLEAIKLGFTEISWITKRSIANELGKDLASNIRVIHPNDVKVFEGIVIECTGIPQTINKIIGMANARTKIGILGSPRIEGLVDLYRIHRMGLEIFGMHELINFDPNKRQCIFEGIIQWLNKRDLEMDKWIKIHPGNTFEPIAMDIFQKRIDGAFHVFDWR